jgi:hypothetical protein
VDISIVLGSLYGIIKIKNEYIYYVSFFVLIRCVITFIGWIAGFLVVIFRPEIFELIMTDCKQLVQFLERYYPDNQKRMD